jgi:hypothetical protein
MATGVDIDKHLFNSLHRLIALIEPGAGSNFERPLLAQSGRTPRRCRQLRAISGCQRNVRFKPPFSVTKMLVS